MDTGGAISREELSALLESELRIDRVLDALDLSITITRSEYGSPRPTIVYANAATARLIGYEPDELIGRGPEVWQGPEVDLADIIEIGDRLRRGESVSIHPNAVRKDGSRIRVTVVMTPIPTAKATYVIAAAHRFSDGDRGGEILGFADLSMDLSSGAVVRGDEELDLTPTEAGLLKVFLLHPGEVLSRGYLFGHLWGFDPGDTSHAVDVYVGCLRRKTEVGERPRLVHTVRGAGYVLRETS